jgi:hypothetical protein
MTKFMPLFVPYAERRLAQSLGAEWYPRARRWVCSTTRYRSAKFKRWRDASCLQHVRVYPDSTPQGIVAAKAHDCAWDATKKEWFVDITSTDTLTPWHLDRLVPPPEHVLRVSYDEREHAKRRGARWNTAMKAWVLCTREPLGRWASKRCAAVQAPATAIQQTDDEVARAANGCCHVE